MTWERRDPLGIVYTSSWVDSHGVTNYMRDHARGTACGPAHWTNQDDVNPICGHHLASKCLGCGVCMTCDGCYCRENIMDDWEEIK